MRRMLLIVPFVLACGGSEQTRTDTATMAMTPATLTDADLAGNWTGEIMMEASDSVIGRFTDVCGGGTCRAVFEGRSDTVVATYRIQGDSVHGTSAPYAEPTAGGAMVVDNWSGRVEGNRISGINVVTLAEKPDSVLGRFRFTGTKGP